MNSILLSILFLIYLQFCLILTIDNKKLLYSNIIYRHGHRTPLSIFPKSEHKYWIEGIGELTNEGKLASYKLGQILAQRYIENEKFISKYYNSSQVEFRSSGSERCLMSAELVAAGFYPPIEKQVWNKDLKWQPVPIQTVANKNDCLLRGQSCECPIRQKLLKKQYTSKIAKEFINQNKLFYNFLSNFTGTNITFENDFFLYDELEIENNLNMTLPNWVSNSTLKQLKESIEFKQNLTISGPLIEFKKIYGGLLINEISKNFESIKNNYKLSKKNINNEYASFVFKKNLYKQKAKFYSTHDITLMSLFNILNINNQDIDFTACILLEVYSTFNNTLIVELHYRNGTKSDDFVKLSIPNCNNTNMECTLDQFLLIIKDVKVNNINEVCQLDSYDHFVIHISKITVLFYEPYYYKFLILFTLLIFMIYSTYYFLSFPSRKHDEYEILSEKY